MRSSRRRTLKQTEELSDVRDGKESMYDVVRGRKGTGKPRRKEQRKHFGRE